jgi:hypothetical protein
MTLFQDGPGFGSTPPRWRRLAMSALLIGPTMSAVIASFLLCEATMTLFQDGPRFGMHVRRCLWFSGASANADAIWQFCSFLAVHSLRFWSFLRGLLICALLILLALLELTPESNARIS